MNVLLCSFQTVISDLIQFKVMRRCYCLLNLRGSHKYEHKRITVTRILSAPLFPCRWFQDKVPEFITSSICHAQSAPSPKISPKLPQRQVAQLGRGDRWTFLL